MIATDRQCYLEEKATFRIVLCVFFFVMLSSWTAAISLANVEEDAEFVRLHLDVKPLAGWKKVEVHSGLCKGCMTYADEGEGIALLACPILNKKDLQEFMEDKKGNNQAMSIGKGVVSQGYDGTTASLVLPLKEGEGGALFIIQGECEGESYYKHVVPVYKKGVQMLAFNPKLLQRVEPMLRAFKNFDIPEKLPDLVPIIIDDQEALTEKYSAKRNWNLVLTPGWIERAPVMKASCLDGGDAMAYAKYILSDYTQLRITVRTSSKSAEEIAKNFYDNMKNFEKEFPDSGEFWSGVAEKNGTWILEKSQHKYKDIYYITSSNGLYSEIEIETLKNKSFKDGLDLLGRLRPDDPAIFPRSYE